MKTVQHRSAGGLVVQGARILLISTQSGRRWQLPKGHIEEGETPEQTAVREVREETGVTSKVVAPLPGVEYWFVERGTRRTQLEHRAENRDALSCGVERREHPQRLAGRRRVRVVGVVDDREPPDLDPRTAHWQRRRARDARRGVLDGNA